MHENTIQDFIVLKLFFYYYTARKMEDSHWQ